MTEGIYSVNSEQREVFSAIHTWTKNYVKYDRHKAEPIHIFLSGSGGTDKSHLVRVTYNVISKTLLYYCKDPEKLRVLLLEPKRISAVNIGGTIISTGLGIKPGIKLLGFNGKSIVALRNRLWEVKLLFIDQLFMVLSDLWTETDWRLGEIFMMIPEKSFSGLSVMTLVDLFDLLPAYIFKIFL